MSKITPGNRLYLYQLFSRELGMRRQTLLPRVEEVLAADGLAPADLGCNDMRELCEQLPEFIKLTVFKKGYVYATVIECEEYDRSLAKLGSDSGEKSSASGKPWKRKRGAKGIKPVKPRHIEVVVEKEPLVEAPEEVSAPKAPEVDEKIEELIEGTIEPTSEAEVASEAEPESAPEPEDKPEPEVEPASEPTPAPTPEPEPTPAPAQTPSISLTITYVPEPEPASDAAPVPAPQSSPAPESTTPRIQSDLPQDFHTDVRCSSEQLSILYQVLPADVDPMATLEEDFRVARSTGELEGTRSNVTFSLRYLQPDGVTPVRVTLRRSAKAVAGKRWALTEIEAGSLEDVDLDGLAEKKRGAWQAFAGEGADADLERQFAQRVAIGSWDETLQQLAQLAAPESWGPGLEVLRDYLTMTFSHARAHDALLVTPDGSRAEFDTGLVTEQGMPVYAHLSPLTGDIPWQLDEFSTSGEAQHAPYAAPLAALALDRSLDAPSFSQRALVERSPRLATPAYDPLSDRVVLLVPNKDGALALLPTDGGYAEVARLTLRDAYSCARVISSEQPAWLAAGLED